MNGNGMYAAVKDNAGVRAVFIEEEVLDLHRLNAKTAQRRNAAAQMATENAKAAEKQQRDLAKAARRKAMATRRLIVQELKVLAGVIVVGLGMRAGLVAAAWAIPVLAFFQAVIFFKAGKYFGKYFPRWFQLWQ